MIRTLPLASLGMALLTAIPASAQLGSAACEPHRANEVRCAVRTGIPGGNRVYEVMINAARLGGEARMVTDTYVSVCGSAGRMIGRGNIANSGTSRVATFTNERSLPEIAAQTLAGVCVEVFVLNCTQAGQPVNCQRVMNLGASRIEIR